ncbi:MAG TPA: cupin domain-containing protein [Chloroflexota bacterium]|jgi:uncharacterized cupin superfamily protein
MADGPRPIRRVVTGRDERGRSGVLWDGPAPNAIGAPVRAGAGMTDLWVYHRSPALISGERDDGHLPYSFDPPPDGGHLRIVQSQGRPPGYDPAADPRVVPAHEPRLRPDSTTWDRGGANSFSSPVHKTETVDYGIVLQGERTLLLDDRELVMRPGDVVVQVGNWHGWTNPREGSLMAFVMMGGTFRGQSAAAPAGAAQGSEPAGSTLPDGVRPVRRIVTIDGEDGKSTAVQDGPSPAVRTDPARPGYAATRLWVTTTTPAPIEGVRETLHLPHTLEPPPRGSVCRIVTFPPDATWSGKVGAKQVAAYFAGMGSPGASTYSPQARHPYMQQTRTLDFCLVLEGEITLVLDTAEVHLRPLDAVIQRGTNHAWSNRSNQPCVVAFSCHDATY